MAIGNVMGGPFFEWVTDQIEVRQRSLGQIKLDADGNPFGTSLDTPNLLYQQSKTPWLRLASSVDFYENETGGIDILKRLSAIEGISRTDIEGKNAAKNFILQGGAVSAVGKDSFRQNAGLNLSSNPFNGAYGWGGISQRGLVPMPGITGASVKFLNDGALTKTEINIKCYSKSQIALVDALYMRPGYTLLLEFGWSTYLDNNGKLQNYDNFYSPALSYLFDPNLTEPNQHILITKILQERKNRFGNYEGVFGKITNFKWNFNPDGSYDCIVYLTGLGEVIESLKTNIALSPASQAADTKKGENQEESDEEEENAIPLIANAEKTTLNRVLFNIYQNAQKQDPPPAPPKEEPSNLDKAVTILNAPVKLITNAVIAPFILVNKALGSVIKKMTNGDQDDTVKDAVIKDFPNVDNEGNLDISDITIPKGVMCLGGTDTDDDNNESPQVYITFGYLIALIQKHIVFSDGDTKTPYFIFDMSFENLNEDRNFIKKIPGQFSSNPLCCLVPYTNHNITKDSFQESEIKNSSIEFSQFMDTNTNQTLTKEGADWNAETYLGRLSCAYVNVNYIAKVLSITGGDSTNAKPMLDFLKAIIKDMTKSLGGINDIILKNNAEGNKIIFFENAPQRFDNEPEELSAGKMCRFNTYGFTNGIGGSIVRNLGIDGSISSNFSSMISIGAQSNGNQVGANATSFSNYNAGIIDRVIPSKTYDDSEAFSPGDINQDGVVDEEEQQKLNEAEEKRVEGVLSQATNINKSMAKMLKSGFFDKLFDGGGGVFGDIYRDRQWMLEDIDLLTEMNTQYLGLINGVLSQPLGGGGTGQLSSPFFLPFNFNMEIDGIGGIGLMQKFKIDEKILPPAYEKDSVEIIVRGVNHDVDGSAWITTLDTQSTPVAKLEKVIKPNPLAPTAPPSSTTNVSSGGPGNSLPPPPGEQPPEDELLRIRITRIMDDGTQTLGIMDVLDEDESTILYSLATSELPWLGNQNRKSCVPVDNYRVKSHSSSKYARCFWVIGNEKGNYAYNRIYDNGYTRTAILIHMAPTAPGWLLGCISPGPKFNDQNNQKGKQKGTGQRYLQPAKDQSIAAMSKLVSTLYSAGSFKMEIVNANGAANFSTPSPIDGVSQWSALPRDFSNSNVQSAARAKNLLPNPYNA